LALYGAETWTLRAADQKYLKSFGMWCWRKDGVDQLDRSCEKWRSVNENQWAEEYPTRNKKTEG